MLYSLKKPSIENYIKAQFQSLKINDYFVGRREGIHEKDCLIKCGLLLSKRFSLKLRDTNLLLMRIRLILSSIPTAYYLDETLLVSLLMIREHNKELYDKYADSPIVADKVIEFIAQGLSLEDRQSHTFCLIAAYLIAPIRDDRVLDFDTFIDDYKKSAVTTETENIIRIIDSFRNSVRGFISHKPTIESIELLHQIDINL